jgi:hypothetical protein
MYKTIILPVTLFVYGCGTWSLSLREEERGEYLDLREKN